jgi:membrane associated rhomboid family serine protease
MRVRPGSADWRTGLMLVGTLAGLMWLVEIADLVLGDLDANGIRPREPEGLVGVVTAPFLHGGFGHLMSNTLSFLVLGGLVALSGLVRVAAVIGVVALVGGVGTWLVAAAGTVHIGASGLVFGFAAYLLARGLFSRRPLHLAVGLVVLVLYGSTLLIGLVPAAGISWAGHLFGALGGLVAARLLDAGRDARLPATPAARALG